MRKILVMSGGVFLSVLGLAWGAIHQEDTDKFKIYNPDGRKYEFVKNYIAGLNYFKLNEIRNQKMGPISLQDLGEEKKIRLLENNLNLDNVNLRIARNLLKKFRSSENGLMLKTTAVFSNVCDEQVKLNNKEKEIIGKLYDLQVTGGLGDKDKEQLSTELKNLAYQRKELLKQLLEASFWLQKVLISNKADAYGEYVKLGLTRQERSKLIAKLEENFGKSSQKGIKEGETYLAGSIALIREILEDDSWSMLDSKK